MNAQPVVPSRSYSHSFTGPCWACHRRILPDEDATFIPSENPIPGEERHRLCESCAAKRRAAAGDTFESECAAADAQAQRDEEIRVRQFRAELERAMKATRDKKVMQAGQALEVALSLLTPAENDIVSALMMAREANDRDFAVDDKQEGRIRGAIVKAHRDMDALPESRRRLVDSAVSARESLLEVLEPLSGDAFARARNVTPAQLDKDTNSSTLAWQPKKSGGFDGPLVLQFNPRVPAHRKSEKLEKLERFMETARYQKMKKLYQDVIWMLVKAGASQAQVAEWSGMKRPNVSRLLREACVTQ
jgi:hypothetical protein